MKTIINERIKEAFAQKMEQITLKNVNYCLNTNIYYFIETSSGQSSNLCLNVLYFFNASVNYMSVAAQDSCFPALVPNMRCSIGL